METSEEYNKFLWADPQATILKRIKLPHSLTCKDDLLIFTLDRDPKVSYILNTKFHVISIDLFYYHDCCPESRALREMQFTIRFYMLPDYLWKEYHRLGVNRRDMDVVFNYHPKY